MRYGRHSADKDTWDAIPSRSAERAAAVEDKPRRPRRRKDRLAYCKPSRGPHVVAIKATSRTCGWRVIWKPRTRDWIPWWTCHHREECKACHKVLRTSLGASCPDHHEPDAQERQALAKEIARRIEWKRSSTPPRKEISGPQSYRKRREQMQS